MDLIICGTGDFAREVYYWIIDAQSTSQFKFKGFLDSNDTSLAKYGLERFYLGSEDEFEFTFSDYILIPIADSKIRNKIFTKLNKNNVNFTNFIHPSVKMGGNIQFGIGNIICPNCIFTCDIVVGNFNIFNLNVTVGHDVAIRSYNTINSHCDITGYSTLKDNNFLGSRVSLLPKCKIGSNNKVAAGSVVHKGIKDNLIYMGNPALKIASNE